MWWQSTKKRSICVWWKWNIGDGHKTNKDKWRTKIPVKWKGTFFKKCHSQIQPKFQCVSCNLQFGIYLGKHYNMDEYDFKQYIVSRCLPDVSHEQDDPKYICLSCDKTLHITDNENPVVPYHVKDKCLIAAAKFMKLLLEKP